MTVTYWPSTEPSIKKQVHPVEDIRISPWPVDVVEFGADAYAHRQQVNVKQLYNQVPQTAWVSWSSRQADSQFESVRCSEFQSVAVRVAVPVGDKMPEWEPTPDGGLGLSRPRLSDPAEWGISASMIRGTWGQYVAVSLHLQLTSHT